MDSASRGFRYQGSQGPMMQPNLRSSKRPRSIGTAEEEGTAKRHFTKARPKTKKLAKKLMF